MDPQGETPGPGECRLAFRLRQRGSQFGPIAEVAASTRMMKSTCLSCMYERELATSRLKPQTKFPRYPLCVISRRVAQWRFEPGRLGATPVDVLVTIEVDFFIR
jgi:hypothetical protein